MLLSGLLDTAMMLLLPRLERRVVVVVMFPLRLLETLQTSPSKENQLSLSP